jgi:hypothetical protein
MDVCRHAIKDQVITFGVDVADHCVHKECRTRLRRNLVSARCGGGHDAPRRHVLVASHDVGPRRGDVAGHLDPHTVAVVGEHPVDGVVRGSGPRRAALGLEVVVVQPARG